jgi:hypothetical protein
MHRFKQPSLVRIRKKSTDIVAIAIIYNNNVRVETHILIYK